MSAAVIDFCPSSSVLVSTIEMEEALLGFILFDPSILEIPAVCTLPVAALSISAHRILFGKILEASKAGYKPNLLVMQSKLAESGLINDIGGRAKLAQLWDRQALDYVFAVQYAVLLNEQYQRQYLIGELNRAAELVGGERDFNTAVQKMKERLEAMMHISLDPESDAKKFYDFMEFINKPSQIQDWVVPGIAYRGGLFILSGRPKVGKSLLFTDLAMAAMEGSCLGAMCSVPRLKVLLISTDEGEHETIDKMIKRGFDDLENCNDRMHIITAEHGISLDNLAPLEEQLRDWQPDLVLMDSVRSLAQNSAVSENDAAFGKPLKRIKDLMEQYHCAGIIIHHDSKDPLKTGVDALSGSTAIASNVSGWMRVIAQDPKDERNPHRILVVGNSRGGDPFRYLLKINPDSQWLESGCFEYLEEIGDQGAGDTKAMLDRVLEFLSQNRGTGYTAVELHNTLGGNQDTLYKALSKGIKLQLFARRKEAREFQRVRGRKPWIYFLPSTEGGEDEGHGDVPPVPDFPSQGVDPPHDSFQKFNGDGCNPDLASDAILGGIVGIISGIEDVPEIAEIVPEISNPDAAWDSGDFWNPRDTGSPIVDAAQNAPVISPQDVQLPETREVEQPTVTQPLQHSTPEAEGAAAAAEGESLPTPVQNPLQKEQTPLQVGDRVRIHCPGTSKNGKTATIKRLRSWGKMQLADLAVDNAGFRYWEAQVRWLERLCR